MNTGPKPEDLHLQILHRRLTSVCVGAPIAVFGTFASALLLLAVFRTEITDPIIIAWAALLFVCLAARMMLLRSIDLERVELEYVQGRLRAVTATISGASLLWAVAFPLFAARGDAFGLIVLASVGAMMWAGVLLMHRNIPGAAYFHIATMGVGIAIATLLVVGLSGWPYLLMAAFYAVLMWLAVGRLNRLFASSIISELQSKEAAETVSMLLHDYEEHSTDWLWSTGPDGTLCDVGPRFAAALCSDIDRLEGRPLTDLFEPGEDFDSLKQKLANRMAFRDLLVKLMIEGDVRYWRLTARPREDGRMSGVARDVTENRRTEERIAYMAHFDNLTGLANRHQFNTRLTQALNASAVQGRNLALFYLDLDNFKSINDTRGHLTGDRLLVEVARRLADEADPEDLVARLGGDEFAVLIETRAGMGMLIERAHRLLSAVRAPHNFEGLPCRISTSVGIARCSGGERCDAEELMRRADLALFAAKRKGRDTLAIFEPSLDREARERNALENDLRDALSRGELRVHYQPIIDLDSGNVSGYEALLRWQHPRRGLVAPSEFLEIAEDTGLIVPIGEWVVRQALAETASWAGNFRIAINLSPTQVCHPHLVALVAQAIDVSGIAPERVEFEITEHVLMQEGDMVLKALERLRSLGARIALDDFGTGYSSLNYLRRFPFDRIKIDRAFVERIDQDKDSQAIVATITNLAETLGMHTTAEGIENRTQLDLLRTLGCNEAQGFLISEPAPGAAFAMSESAEVAMVDHGPEVLDYRKARAAVIRRRSSEAG